MHECGTRSGGCSSIVSRASPSYSRREKGSGKIMYDSLAPWNAHDIIKRDVTNRKQLCAYILSCCAFILRFDCCKMSASVSRVDKPLQQMIIHNEVF